MADRPDNEPLRWRSHRLGVRRDSALRYFSIASPAALESPWASIAADAPPAAAAAAGAAAELFDLTLSLPDLSGLPDPLARCAKLLAKAADIEHALMVQYLYAAYSFKELSRREIAGVAIEEMSHLMTVQNLLLLIRHRPHLGRQDFGTPESIDDRVFPFDLLLEPLTKASLAKYVTAEAPRDAGPEQPLVERIREIATEATGGEAVNRVGVLYALLGVIVGTDDLIAEQAKENGPFKEWYQTVAELSATVLETGKTVSETYGHLLDGAFDGGSVPGQASNRMWDRSRNDPDTREHFRVHTAATRLEALNALADIGVQGEGPSQSDPRGTHFERFFTMFKTKFGPEGAGMEQFNIHGVPVGAVIPVGPVGPNSISHSDTVLVARLANLRYALLLGFLEQYFIAPVGGRDFLVGWCFAEMFYLRQFGDWLIRLKRAQDSPDTVVAAIPFTMPPRNEAGLQAGARWGSIHAERFAEAIDIAEQIQSMPVFANRAQFIAHMLDSDRRRHAEAVERQDGKSVRTRFDHVRDILDAGAGVGVPVHTGELDQSRGRFWNVSRDEFVGLVIRGAPILKLGNGAASRLVKVLAHEEQPFMPGKRPALVAEDVSVIRQWIDDGCPDTQ